MTDTFVIPSKTLMTVLHLDYDNAPEHLMRQALWGNIKAAAELYNLGHYKKVATYLGTGLDAAFASTQNIDHPWINNKGVGPLDDDGRGYRSTSVGDILVLNNEPFVVASTGFDPVPIVLNADHRTS